MWLLCRRKIDAHACTRQFCALTCRGRGMSWVVACDCFVGVRFDVHDTRGSFDIVPKRCTCRSHTCHMRTFICIIMHQVDFRCCIVIDAHSYASACARSFVMELNTLFSGTVDGQYSAPLVFVLPCKPSMQTHMIRLST